MKRTDFCYELPERLIALYPTPERRASRLLCLDGHSGAVKHRQFVDLLNLVNPGDLLVFNDTKVIPARLYGQKQTGGRVEVLIERLLADNQVLAHVRASKTSRSGSILLVGTDSGAGIEVTVIGRDADLFVLQFPLQQPVLTVLDRLGHIPLPPYIDRPDEISDQERYQTVYGKTAGAVAAPTAGLHFDEAMLQQLADKGVELAFVTLHVGAGTFQPVRAEDIEDHRMHSEYIEVTEEVCAKVQRTRSAGGRVIAVGTTSVRCLETASANGITKPYRGDTDIFIYPGYRFRCVDALLTNFHLPESSLIMLVSAFAGHAAVMEAYRQAIALEYRFFSYGDAMFIARRNYES